MGKKRRRLVNHVFTSEATQTTTLVLGLFPTVESKRIGNSLQTRNSTPGGVPFSRPRTTNEPSTFQCGWQEQSKSLGTCQEYHPVLNQKRTKKQLIFLECWAMKFVIRALVFHIWASDSSHAVLLHTWRPDMYFNHHGHMESSIWAKTNLLHLTPHQSLLLPLWWCVFFCGESSICSHKIPRSFLATNHNNHFFSLSVTLRISRSVT